MSSELNIYNWEDYLAPEVIEGFEKEFGVKINVSTYDDEFIMLDEYRKNPDLDKYDLVVASDAIVEKIIEENLALPINEKNIPNMKNIESVFKDTAFNAKKTYVVPYYWGTTGILVNTKFISDVDSWGVFWNANIVERCAC